MNRTRALPLVLLLVLVACSSSSEGGSPAPAADAGPPECTEGTAGCVGWVTCPPEFEKADEGGCREIVAESECAPGTTPRLGDRTCVPVGTTTCATGFEPDPSGWGCRAIVPAQACTGATRDALGSTSCVAVGDCSAPFPPAGALVVNGSFSDAELGPKKFKSIAAAVVAAKNGETVAIETGNYPEGIIARAGVTIAGRCAEKVRLVGTGLEVHGVLADGTKDVVVKGVTLVDHYEGARATRGGTLDLEDVVIEGPRSVGFIAWQASSTIRARRVVVRGVKAHADQTVEVASVNADEGARIELTEVALSGSLDAGVVLTNPSASKTPSSVTITRSVIRDTNLSSHTPAGSALVASGLSHGELIDSAILDTRRLGAITIGAQAELAIARSEVRRTLEDASGEASAGIYAEGGKINLDDVSIHDAVQGGIFVRSNGTVIARRVVVQGTRPGADGVFGMGAWVDSGGKLTLEESALVDNAYYGASVITSPSNLSLRNVLIRGTAAQKVDAGGLGRAVNVEDGAAVEIDGVSAIANDGEGLFLRGETTKGERARATAKRLLIADSRTFDGTGVFVAKGAKLDIDGGLVRAAQRAGVIVNETSGEKGSRSEATLTHVIVRGTKRNGSPASDPKNFALDGIGIGNAGNLTVRASAIVDNIQFGVIVGNSGTLSTFENVFIGATKLAEDGSFGHGLVAFDGTNLALRNTEIAANNVGLVFAGSTAVVSGSRVRGNAVGIQAQRGSTLVSGTEVPEAPEAGVVFVTDDSEFIDNTSRVGSGEIPLPTDPFAGSGSSKK